MIDLYYWPTPNGKKVTILLEECGLPYNIVPLNIGRGDQFKDDFLQDQPQSPHAHHGRPRAQEAAARPSASSSPAPS